MHLISLILVAWTKWCGIRIRISCIDRDMAVWLIAPKCGGFIPLLVSVILLSFMKSSKVTVWEMLSILSVDPCMMLWLVMTDGVTVQCMQYGQVCTGDVAVDPALSQPGDIARNGRQHHRRVRRFALQQSSRLWAATTVCSSKRQFASIQYARWDTGNIARTVPPFTAHHLLTPLCLYRFHADICVFVVAFDRICMLFVCFVIRCLPSVKLLVSIDVWATSGL